jgi:hypothetical protein
MLLEGALMSSNLPLPAEAEIRGRVVQYFLQESLVKALKCHQEKMDDAASFFCGKSLEETLCMAWLLRHSLFYSDLLANKILGFKKICDGKDCQNQSPICPPGYNANLGGFIRWAQARRILTGQSLVEANYINDKRNDHGHSYAVRLYGQTTPGKIAPNLGSDPDTPTTIRRTLELIVKLIPYTEKSTPI